VMVKQPTDPKCQFELQHEYGHTVALYH
jgi:hypothetical protein